MVHFETTAARGLKFWLQVALSAPIATPWTQIRKSGSGKSGFSKKSGKKILACTDSPWPQGRPPIVPDSVRTPQDPPEASKGPWGRFALLNLNPYNMGVYGLHWIQLGHQYWYIPRYFSVLLYDMQNILQGFKWMTIYGAHWDTFEFCQIWHIGLALIFV